MIDTKKHKEFKEKWYRPIPISENVTIEFDGTTFVLRDNWNDSYLVLTTYFMRNIRAVKTLLAIILLCVSSASYAVDWECLNSNYGWCNLERMPTPKGWIVKYSFPHGGGLTYVPDPKHEWKV